MCFGSKGFEAVNKLNFIELFSESNTRWVVEIKESDLKDYINFLGSNGLKGKHVGFVADETISFGSIEIDVDEAEKVWREGLTRFTGW